jgi:hypothetical protein
LTWRWIKSFTDSRNLGDILATDTKRAPLGTLRPQLDEKLDQKVL